MTSARDVAESQSAVAPWAGWSLEGRVALVTGSTRGLGRSIALALARARADIGFAQAYAPKVRVNTIMPGPFATDIATNWSPEVAARVARSTLLERVGHPDEIVGTALYLASDASTFTTGATIIVDGGMAATL